MQSEIICICVPHAIAILVITVLDGTMCTYSTKDSSNDIFIAPNTTLRQDCMSFHCSTGGFLHICRLVLIPRLIWNTAVGFGRSALLRVYSKTFVINFIEMVNCGFFGTTHLILGILRLLLHDFYVELLMRVCYSKRSSSPLSNFSLTY